jgi:hypothetical protein
MGRTSDPETLVIHQKLTPGNNLKTFKQHYDQGGSLQLHMVMNIRGAQNAGSLTRYGNTVLTFQEGLCCLEVVTVYVSVENTFKQSIYRQNEQNWPPYT